MFYLGLALYAEGRTDYYFLRPLLRRLCEQICTSSSPHQVEFSEVLELDDSQTLVDAARETRILDAAKRSREAWKVLFVHTDGAGDPAAAKAERVQPALDLIAAEFATDAVGVSVVPIRETEAWALADPLAVQKVFGTTLTCTELGLPEIARGAESVLDPKTALGAAFLATNPSGRRRRSGVSPMLSALGEQVSFDRLRLLPGFVSMETDLKAALRELHVI